MAGQRNKRNPQSIQLDRENKLFPYYIAQALDTLGKETSDVIAIVAAFVTGCIGYLGMGSVVESPVIKQVFAIVLALAYYAQDGQSFKKGMQQVVHRVAEADTTAPLNILKHNKLAVIKVLWAGFVLATIFSDSHIGKKLSESAELDNMTGPVQAMLLITMPLLALYGVQFVGSLVFGRCSQCGLFASYDGQAKGDPKTEELHFVVSG